MKMRSLFVLISIFATSFASAQTVELFEAVEKSAIATFTTDYKSHYGLRSQLYTSKRYRIVRIKFDVLDQENVEFTITPWAGLVLKVKTLNRNVRTFDGIRHWRGELQNGGEMALGYAFRPLVYFVIGSHEIVTAGKVKKMLAKRPSVQVDSVTNLRNIPGIPDSAPIRLDVKTLSGSVYVPDLATDVVIRPLADDPRFHVVMEEDPSKIVQGGEFMMPGDMEKLESHKKFLQDLDAERLRDEQKASK